jgi:diguanylate cyclase (GGDEF)-like protein
MAVINTSKKHLTVVGAPKAIHGNAAEVAGGPPPAGEASAVAPPPSQAPHPESLRPAGPLAHLILGHDWKQRLRTRRSLRGALNYAVFAVLINLAAQQGWLPQGPVLQVTAVTLAMTVVFYALLRSGLNRQFTDPALTMPQMLLPATVTAWMYTFGGPLRDMVLVLLAPVLLFGFRHLRPAKVRLLSGYVLALMGCVMVWLVHHDPKAHDMGNELLRFMLVAVVVVTLWQYTASDTEESSGVLHALGVMLFTHDPKQRLRIQRYMMAAANFVICTIVLAYAVSTGAVDAGHGWWLGCYMMVNVGMFYALLRSGLNLHFADPSLTLPQIMVALVCVVWSYAILGESRGAALILLALILMFGMFNLTAKQTRMAAFFALCAQGLTMLFMATLAPERFPARQEMVNFLFACTSLPTISVLSGQLSTLRHRLQSRKEELAEALSRIQTLATRDELTGLFNRRHMMETLSLQKKFSDQGGRIFCIGILDIDHFKQVNDTHGHGVGYEVLRHFAQHAQSVMRDSDVIARWGGEEFLLMLTDCRLDQAEAGLERLREVINAAPMSDTVAGLRVTFSSGLTEQRYEETLDQTIERADQALYRAKRGGRNRTMAS